VEVDNIGIGASTVDDRGGGVNLKGERLREFLEKDEVKITIYIKPTERIEIEYFSHLQSLYNYCLTGRFSVEVPSVEGGCDKWELDYIIGKHERYLERHPLTDKTRSHNSIVLEQLGLLYEKKGEYEKAIKNLKKAKEIRFFRQQDLDDQIEKIQKNLGGK
jgi:tetratricopeptide (TPR) repeat protein